MSGLVLLVTACNSWICYKNRYAELLVLHYQNVASLILFSRYLVNVHLNWVNWFHFLILEGGLLSTCYCDRLHHISVNSFFSHIVRFLNSLPIEYFPLTYDLHGFKSRINRHLLTVKSL